MRRVLLILFLLAFTALNVFACRTQSNDSVILKYYINELQVRQISEKPGHIVCFERNDTLIVWTDNDVVFSDKSIWSYGQGIECVKYLCEELNPSEYEGVKGRTLNVDYTIAVPADLMISTEYDTVLFHTGHHLGIVFISENNSDTILSHNYGLEGVGFDLSSFIITDTVLDYMGIYIGVSQRRLFKEFMGTDLKNDYNHVVLTCCDVAVLDSKKKFSDVIVYGRENKIK